MENFYYETLRKMYSIMEPGDMLYGNPTDLTTGKEEFCLYIKETEEILNSIPINPQIQTNGVAFGFNNVVVAILYVKLFGADEALYCAFINYYSTDEEGEHAIENLLTQDRINLCFMDNKPEVSRVISIENGFKYLAKEVKEASEYMRPGWSMKSFDIAKEQIERRYSLRGLWEQLTTNQLSV